MHSRGNIPPRHRRTRVIRLRRLVARARSPNITCEEYPVEQTRNTPEFEISYSPSHVSEDLTINLLPDDFSLISSSIFAFT